jgi:tRNA(fMet)-specific endonuclease VapC
MYILDSDTLTHLHAGHPRVIKALQKLEDPEVVTTIVTKIELLRGRFEFLLKADDSTKLLKAQQLLLRTEELLSQINILALDETTVNQFDYLRNNRSLRKIGRADLLIASMALAKRATLVTRNLSHFKKVPGLKAVNWVD